jgi:hypothetical protein
MYRIGWKEQIQRWLSGSREPKSSRVFSPLSLEQLESRLTPAVFNVGAGDVATLITDINTANSNGQSNTINLTNSIYSLPAVNNYWYGPNGLPPITSNLTINGNGATLFRDSGDLPFRFFYVSGGMELPAGSLTMDNLTLQGGLAEGGNSNLGGGGLGAGGAIFNQGTLNLTAVTLTDNAALGGSSGVSSTGDGGGGMGGDTLGTLGGGFGGSLGNQSFGGQEGQGGGGGFLSSATGGVNGPGIGGGQGGFGDPDGGGDGGNGGPDSTGGTFGAGGFASSTGMGGGGGVGGGGGLGVNGGDGGFGGGGGGGVAASDGAFSAGGKGGFGGGGGGGGTYAGFGGFGGGNSASYNGNGGGGGAGLGGAIFNMGADSAHAGSSGQATLTNCTLTSNTAQGGNGGVNPAGNDQGNSAQGQGGDGYGGALFNLDGKVTLLNATVAGNGDVGGSGSSSGIGDGGAVYNLAYGNDIDTGHPVTATVVLNNNILATSSTGHDLVSTVGNNTSNNTATVSGSTNLVMNSSGTIGAGVITLTANPNLLPLNNYGGLTPTMPPQTGSPVLAAGDSVLAPATDQLGNARPPNGPTDLGAVQISTSSGGGNNGAGNNGGGSQRPNAGFLGLAIEAFEFEVDTVLTEIYGFLYLGSGQQQWLAAEQQEQIAAGELWVLIVTDVEYGTSMGDMAIELGEAAGANYVSQNL